MSHRASCCVLHISTVCWIPLQSTTPNSWNFLFASCFMLHAFCFLGVRHAYDIVSIGDNNITSQTHRPDDGGSKDLWNIGKLLPDYTALQPWRQPSSGFFFSSYMLRRTYRTALQQTPKMSTTFSKTSIHPKCCYKSVYCCLIRYFLVRIRIVKCFTNSSKRFRCEVTFENEHSFCSWIHHVRTCTAFVPLAWAAALVTRVTLTRVSRGRLGENVTQGWTCFWFHFCTVVRGWFGLRFRRYVLY
jgi:hypothetical protein